MRLVLGTAQFGLDYGVSNTGGRTPFAEVLSILAFAAANSVDTLDTAAAYGDAEDVLARAGVHDRGFRIISKTARLTDGVDAVIERALLSAENSGALSMRSSCIRPATSLSPTANGFGMRCGDLRVTVRSRALEFHFMSAIRFWISSRNIVPNWHNFPQASTISGSFAMEQLRNWRGAALKFMCDRPFIKASFSPTSINYRRSCNASATPSP